MIMVIYLLTALLLGGFGNYMIPLMIGARDMVFPYMNMLSYWAYLLSVIVLLASFFVPGGPTGAGWTLYPPQAILQGTPGYDWGIILMLASLAIFIIAFTMGGLNYVTTVLQARTSGMTMMRMPLTIWGIFTATILGILAFPALLVSAIMMMLDKTLGTSFFMPALVSLGRTWITPAAARYCSSTCSGSSATRKCTSLPCRPSAWSPMCWPPTRARISSAIA